MAIKVGQRVRFNPFHGILFGQWQGIRTIVEGEVIAIHKKHNWFQVKYKLGNVELKIAFHFADIGKSVYVCE